MSCARTKIASNSPPSDAVRARSLLAPDLEPGVVEKLAALLIQAAFVGKRYSEHEVELDR